MKYSVVLSNQYGKIQSSERKKFNLLSQKTKKRIEVLTYEKFGILA